MLYRQIRKKENAFLLFAKEAVPLGVVKTWQRLPVYEGGCESGSPQIFLYHMTGDRNMVVFSISTTLVKTFTVFVTVVDIHRKFDDVLVIISLRICHRCITVQKQLTYRLAGLAFAM